MCATGRPDTDASTRRPADIEPRSVHRLSSMHSPIDAEVRFDGCETGTGRKGLCMTASRYRMTNSDHLKIGRLRAHAFMTRLKTGAGPWDIPSNSISLTRPLRVTRSSKRE